MVAFWPAASSLLLEFLFCVLLCEITPNEGELRKAFFFLILQEFVYCFWILFLKKDLNK